MGRAWCAVAVAAALPALAVRPVAQSGASGVGSVCVLPHLLPEQMPYQGAGSLPATRTYAIRLDGGPWVELSTKDRVLLADIPRAVRHKVAIRGDGKPYAAFALTFDREDPDALCLYQNSMYQTWQVHWTKQSFEACRCEGVEPSAWQPPPAAR